MTGHTVTEGMSSLSIDRRRRDRTARRRPVAPARSPVRRAGSARSVAGIDTPARIEDYALLSDTRGAALVDRTGSVDWLCLPRFDADACLAAMLGGPDHGRWLLSVRGAPERTKRWYRGDTLVLETEYVTADG